MKKTDILEVTNFYFQTCGKFRLFSSESNENSSIIHSRLAVSSQLGITFAVSSEHQIICFSTKDLTKNVVNKENMNTEVNNLAIKQLKLENIEIINDVGINCNGTLLAILHTSHNVVFVDIHNIKSLAGTQPTSTFKPLNKIRVGTENTNMGNTIEWNPAFPDIFAVSSSDFSVLVVKIDMTSPTKQTIVGAKKFGAEATVISWSPKGKQLTIGDKVGKVVQLKPELEIVRCTMPPENVQKNLGSVTGLCWLSTTDWVVSYVNNENRNDQYTFLMKCKKDKPTDWILLNDLSYTNDQSKLPASLLTSTELLLSWNLVLSANTKMSQVVPIGKLSEDWQTWTVNEGGDIYLPVKNNKMDSFPVGLAIDRSSCEEVTSDVRKKHRPSPIVMCLTDDGVLTAYHVISTIQSHVSCQITVENTVINGCETSLFLSRSQNDSIKNETKKKENVLQPEKEQLFTQDEITKEKTVEKHNIVISNQDVKRKRDEFTIFIDKIKNEIKKSKEYTGSLTFGVQNARKSIIECSEVVDESLKNTKEVIHELNQLISNVAEQSGKMTHTIKEMDFELEEKMKYVIEKQYHDNDEPLSIVDALRDMYESEKFMRFNKLETAADILREKFADCNEKINQLKTELKEIEVTWNSSVLSPLRSSSGNQLEIVTEEELALKVMRNVSKIILDIKERISRTQLEHKLLLKNCEKNTKNWIVNGHNIQARSEIVNDIKTTDELSGKQSFILKARERILKTANEKRSKKERKVELEKYKPIESPKEKISNILNVTSNNLSNALTKLCQTPRKLMTTSSLVCSEHLSKRDAATQADEPKIIEKIVPKSLDYEKKQITVQPKNELSKSLKNSEFEKLPFSSSQATAKIPVSNQETFSNETNCFQISNKSSAKSIVNKTSDENVTPSSIESDLCVLSNSEKSQSIVEKPSSLIAPLFESKKEVCLPLVTKHIKEENHKLVLTNPEVNSTIQTKDALPGIDVNISNSSTKSDNDPPNFSFSMACSQKQQSILDGENHETSGFFNSDFHSTETSTVTTSGSNSKFGTFGQTSLLPSNPQSVSFSFNNAVPKKTESNPKFDSFATSTTAIKGDDGMDDDSAVNENNLSEVFMTGIGSNAPSTNSSSNIFGSKPAAEKSSNSWLFGGGSGVQEKSKPVSTFSFATAAAQHTQQTSMAATKPFGSSPMFGGTPTFGMKPFGSGVMSSNGSLSKNSSIFGSAGTQSGFSQNSTNGSNAASSSLFGGGIKTTGSSVFGGSSHPAANSGGSSIFGGGGTNISSKFNTWR